MGMSIDQELAEISDLALKIQANYLAILKAEKIAILTEIQLDIQEVNTAPQFLTDDNVKDFRECVDTIIQQKINELKGKENDN